MKALLFDPKWAFVRFLVVGVVNTAFGYLLFALLLYVGLRPQPALAMAFAGGVAWNYFTHARLVFGTRGVKKLPAYILAYLCLYGVNALGLQLLLKAGLAPIIAQGVLVLPVALLAYVVIGRVLTDR
ncbi:GtrA family protein [Sulfitobacter sp. MF3-043]|uniref:GtrA family protein n=1 Tax=Sulfitobacter sediminivivens TaxID=3252902 RepID=UPI0036DCF2E4